MAVGGVGCPRGRGQRETMMTRAWMLGLIAIGVAGLLQAADAERGRALYETRCVGCHETSVHGRARRTAADCAAVRAEVVRWNEHGGGTWSSEEVDDVTLWLNERYYRFPVESMRCATPVAMARTAR
jgi:mono/diheme cytochrome c family protein